MQKNYVEVLNCFLKFEAGKSTLKNETYVDHYFIAQPNSKHNKLSQRISINDHAKRFITAHVLKKCNSWKRENSSR